MASQAVKRLFCIFQQFYILGLTFGKPFMDVMVILNLPYHSEFGKPSKIQIQTLDQTLIYKTNYQTQIQNTIKNPNPKQNTNPKPNLKPKFKNILKRKNK